MAPAQQQFLCKILSGQHQGAEVPLRAGSYRVGRDDSADIVLEDQAIQGEHALLVIETRGLRVEPLLGEVVIGQQAHKDPTALVPFFTVLGLGGIRLAVGPEAAEWPVLEPPAPAGEPQTGPAQVLETAPPPAPAVRKRARWPLGLTLLAPFVAMALANLLAERAPSPPPPAPLTAEEVMRTVTATVGATPVSGLDVRLEPRGVSRDPQRLVVRGWVADEVTRRDLVGRLNALDVSLRLEVWSQEQVMAGVQTTLEALGRPLETAWVGPGEIALKGYIPDASDLQRVVDLLQRDVAGLERVRNEVVTDESIEAALRRRLEAAVLADIVRIKRGDRAIQVRGTVSEAQRAAFAQVAAAHATEFGRYLGLEVQLAELKGEPAPAPALAEPARFALRALSSSVPPYVVLDDGQKYLEGSLLPGGWTLEQIAQDHLLVSRDGRREQVSF